MNISMPYTTTMSKMPMLGPMTYAHIDLRQCPLHIIFPFLMSQTISSKVYYIRHDLAQGQPHCFAWL